MTQNTPIPIWQLPVSEYVAQQQNPHDRRHRQLHVNAVAAAAGAGLPVPKRVLSAYPKLHTHPQYRAAMAARGQPIPAARPAIHNPRPHKITFYEVSLAILASHISMNGEPSAYAQAEQEEARAKVSDSPAQ